MSNREYKWFIDLLEKMVYRSCPNTLKRLSFSKASTFVKGLAVALRGTDQLKQEGMSQTVPYYDGSTEIVGKIVAI